ncbi:MAG: CorA family divalent cation transporter [Chloroflexi bacterium]|nr:CorA family divalent cation transporter [Chloroflexota bacterium]MBU1750792.1 CorA family divalent cation transporter [Chloroflexota bacterium]
MQLPYMWDVPDTIRARFGQKSSGKQRAMFSDGHLLLVLHRAPRYGEREREGTLFWRKPDGEWECTRRDLGKGIRALRKHVQEYEATEEKFRADYEQADSAEDYFRILERMAPLHHAARSLHTTLQAAREAIPGDQDLIDLRDQAYTLERTLDLLHVNTKDALDFGIAKRAEEQARISLQAVQTAHRLNILAALFFPLMAISSVFGMNLSSGLEGISVWIFWFIFLSAILLGLVISLWVLSGSGIKVRWRR